MCAEVTQVIFLEYDRNLYKASIGLPSLDKLQGANRQPFVVREWRKTGRSDGLVEESNNITSRVISTCSNEGISRLLTSSEPFPSTHNSSGETRVTGHYSLFKNSQYHTRWLVHPSDTRRPWSL